MRFSFSCAKWAWLCDNHGLVQYVADRQINSNIGNLEQQEIRLSSPFSDTVYLISCGYSVIRLDEQVRIPNMKLNETWLQCGVRG